MSTKDVRYMEPPETYGIEGDDDSETVSEIVRPDVALGESVLKVIKGELAQGRSITAVIHFVRGLYGAILVDAVLTDVFNQLPTLIAYPNAASALSELDGPHKELIINDKS